MEPKRWYRSNTHVVAAVFAIAFAGLGFWQIWNGQPEHNSSRLPLFPKLAFTLVWMGFELFLLVRFLPSGAYPRVEGLLIRNIFSSRTIPWDDIERFTLRRSGWFYWPIGWAELRDGSAVHIYGISKNNLPHDSAQREIDALNRLLVDEHAE